MSVAAIFFERQQPVHMEKVLQYANRIHPSAKVTNLLAKLAYQRDEVDAALALWKKSLALDEVQVEAHRNLGLVILLRKGEHARAVPHLERAVQLDSTLAEEVQQWLIQAGF
jgi:tetratricopeptide (TPR) repeat protein